MAHVVKTPPLERIFQFINPSVARGSTGEQVYNLPIYLRRDGVIIKLGYLVRKTGLDIVFTVRDILVRGDLTCVTVTISPVECGEGGVAKMKEELLVVDVEEVNPCKGRMMSLELARDGMRKVASSILLYPVHVQRVLRKHQLATQIRTSVQKFLAGFSLARSINIGCVDWRLDPGLLGLERETEFSLEYRVERFVGGVTSHLDLLLGTGWDVRKVGGGFRVIMTLELTVDVNQQIRLNTHATTCQGELDSNYRTRCMEAFSSSLAPPSPNFLLFSKDLSIEHFEKPDDNTDKFESLQSNKAAGISLDWEEFQDSQDEATLEISEEDIDHAIKGAEFPQNAGKAVETPQDSPDSTTIEGDSSVDPSSAIKKLLDTPTKGFSQIVFNVSNKHSGDSNESKAGEVIEKEADHLDDIVNKIREVQLSEDSLEASFEVENKVEHALEPELSPIRQLQESDDDKVNTDYPDLNNFTSDIDHTMLRHSTSTPDGALEEDISLLDSVWTDTTSHNNIDDERNSQEGLDSSQLLKNKTADDTFDNIPDLICDIVSNPTDEVSDPTEEQVKVRGESLSSSSEPLDTKDGPGPEEDQCSEDYRVSSSNENKQTMSKDSPDNDGETVISVVKDQTIKHSSDTKVGNYITPETMVDSPQSSVNKVAAYVQSLPSPRGNMVEEAPEHTDNANNILDESLVEDEANNSLASSRSRASRQSDLSNLTGRFSNGVGGMFFGSALGPSGGQSGQTVCPFPDDWQFNTIPESIENDEDID